MPKCIACNLEVVPENSLANKVLTMAGRDYNIFPSIYGKQGGKVVVCIKCFEEDLEREKLKILPRKRAGA